MAELVDALDSKSCTFGCAGSIPARGTKKITAVKILRSRYFFVFIFVLILTLSSAVIFQNEKQNENEDSIVVLKKNPYIQVKTTFPV